MNVENSTSTETNKSSLSKPKSSFGLFCQDRFETITNRNTPLEISEMLHDEWNLLDEKTREQYIIKAKKAKKEYERLLIGQEPESPPGISLVKLQPYRLDTIEYKKKKFETEIKDEIVEKIFEDIEEIMKRVHDYSEIDMGPNYKDIASDLCREFELEKSRYRGKDLTKFFSNWDKPPVFENKFQPNDQNVQHRMYVCNTIAEKWHHKTKAFRESFWDKTRISTDTYTVYIFANNFYTEDKKFLCHALTTYFAECFQWDSTRQCWFTNRSAFAVKYKVENTFSEDLLVWKYKTNEERWSVSQLI